MPSRRSRLGLNATNFFLGQVVAVVLPFLNTMLRQHGWSYEAIGLATSIVGIGVFLSQAPAGILLDRVRKPRLVLAASSVGIGIGYAAVPFVSDRPLATYAMLLVAGISQAFLAPGLAGLAVDLAEPRYVGRLLGPNRMANHVGHVAAAGLAMVAAPRFGQVSIFLGVFVTAALAAFSCALIRRDDLARVAIAAPKPPTPHRVRKLLDFDDKKATVLVATTALFHLASAPAIPLAALYLDSLSAGGRHVGAMVLASQLSMIPAAFLGGLLCDRIGRRPLFLAAFIAMPVRSLLCALTSHPDVIVAAQLLEGVAAGIEGVALVSMCADLAARHGRFNTLMALATMPLGAVIGPYGTGLLVEHFGFRVAFAALAMTGAIGAWLFFRYMPETYVPETAERSEPALSEPAPPR